MVMDCCVLHAAIRGSCCACEHYDTPHVFTGKDYLGPARSCSCSCHKPCQVPPDPEILPRVLCIWCDQSITVEDGKYRNHGAYLGDPKRCIGSGDPVES